MRGYLLIAIAMVLPAGCAHEEEPAQAASSQTTSGPAYTGGNVAPTTAEYGAGGAAPSGTTNAAQESTSFPTHDAWHRGLMSAALELPSLTPAQRTQIQSLVDQRRSANAEAHAAHAELLNALADAISSGTVSPAMLAPKVQELVAAVIADQPTDRYLLETLHTALTPAQRVELANEAESRMNMLQQKSSAQGGRATWMAKELGLTDAQESQIQANLRALEPAAERDMFTQAREDHLRVLEAFKGDTFSMATVMPVKTSDAIRQWVDHAVVMAEATAPVLTPNQRAIAASILRGWAQKSR